MESKKNNITDLDIGEIGYIKNINLNNTQKDRLINLGFVEGEEIKIITKSPFNGPIIVNLMNYELSISHEEAENIEISLKKEESEQTTTKLKPNEDFQKIKNYLYKNYNSQQKTCFFNCSSCNIKHIDNCETNNTKIKLKFALIGNQNCGKTTLFNTLTHGNENTGNYSGVTVDVKSNSFYYKNYKITLYDLPGTYSLNDYTNDEKVTTKFIKENKIDIYINVIDSTKLKRSLLLTTELKEITNKNIICAFNMYDKFKQSEYTIDLNKFEDNFEMIVEPIISKTGFGLKNLIEKSIILNKYFNLNNNI